ncbi:MAG: hypothetical protein JNK82_13255 [Myxococcaceae bacterium]|nr:hypothetical protein [Myxococcaceae bacterium]
MRTLTLIAVVVLAGCKEKAAEPPPAPGSTGKRPLALDEKARQPSRFPIARGLSPAVMALCDALHQLPAERRGACCNTPTQRHGNDECLRLISLAIERQAVDVRHAARCVVERTAQFEGCGWVGPEDVPLPAGCVGLLEGQLKEGQQCGSVLECSTGLRCVGLSASSPGRCETADGDAGVCQPVTDPLGRAVRHTCEVQPRKAAGEPCEKDDECIAACVVGDGGQKRCGPRC